MRWFLWRYVSTASFSTTVVLEEKRRGKNSFFHTTSIRTKATISKQALLFLLQHWHQDPISNLKPLLSAYMSMGVTFFCFNLPISERIKVCKNPMHKYGMSRRSNLKFPVLYNGNIAVSRIISLKSASLSSSPHHHREVWNSFENGKIDMHCWPAAAPYIHAPLIPYETTTMNMGLLLLQK